MNTNYMPIPQYGHHMTLQEFREAVARSQFIESDGTGQYTTSDLMSEEYVELRLKTLDKIIKDENSLTLCGSINKLNNLRRFTKNE